MNAVKITIVEDQLLVSEALSEDLRAAGYNVIGQYASGEELLKVIDKEVPDLIIMDIHLGGDLDGIQTATEISRIRAVPFIYLTDDREIGTVTRAKHTRPANYITKPFNSFELHVAIEVAFYNACFNMNYSTGDHNKIEATDYLLNESIFIKEKDKFIKIAIEDIIRIEADRSYSKIVTAKKTYMFTGSLSAIHDQLDGAPFLRVHRSHMVNVNKITGINGNTLELGNEKVPVSQSYREAVFKHFRLLK